MGVFGCSVEELARYMASNPGYYPVCVDFLNGLRDLGCSGPGLEEAIKKAEAAHRIATESEYFVFSTTWTWPDRSGEANGEGFSVYQNVKGKLVDAFTFADGIPTPEEVLGFLNERNVKRVFTTWLYENRKYLGLSSEDVDFDGDVTAREAVPEGDYCLFGRAGIEVVFVPNNQ